MIDLTNAPESATHYRKHAFYKCDGDSWMVFIDKKWSLTSLNRYELERDLVSIQCEWSIYNNDKPLSELTDEQRGLLFNHRCNGGDIEAESSSGWMVINCPQWIFTSTYRAKQKSELELFIEAVNEAQSNAALTPLPYAEMLFNAGFKAPKVDHSAACSDSKVSKVK